MGRDHDGEGTVRGVQALKAIVAKRPQFQSSKRHQSVGAQFQYSLNKLMESLSHATPYFIRCIKSNNEKVTETNNIEINIQPELLQESYNSYIT